MNLQPSLEVSVIVPARNEEAALGECLRSLTTQAAGDREIILVDDHSTDRTGAIAAGFPVRVIEAPPLPPGWTGKNNAVWAGAQAATGKWLLFTDADTRHAPDSISSGIDEAQRLNADLLSYSPRQEVRGFAERALMPVIFAELASTYPPRQVCDPASPVAAANGQYLLIRREVYDAVGGHAAVAASILEDVELARRVKQAGYRLQFRVSDTVSTRMYRSFAAMWEGWTKNLALLFPRPTALAAERAREFAVIVLSFVLALWCWLHARPYIAVAAAAVGVVRWAAFLVRIRRAHFDWLSDLLALFGLPLFAILLIHSSIRHKRGPIRWKGRQYGQATPTASSPGDHDLPDPQV